MSQDSTFSSHPAALGLLIWLLVVALAACTPSASHSHDPSVSVQPSLVVNLDRTTELTVFAAASLSDALREIGRAFEEINPGSQVMLNFAGSQQLALQIEQGAQADVFASADQRNMDRLVTAGLITSDVPVTFAHNQMVVILPDENSGQIETLEDLAGPGLKLILAGEHVPGGAYARQVLDNLSGDAAYGLGFKEAVLRNLISNEENVKQVVAKIQLGEADAGIVYSSDVTQMLADKLRRIEVPDQFNIEADYPISILGTASDIELAHQFVQFVLGPTGQRILEQWGFIPVIQGE